MLAMARILLRHALRADRGYAGQAVILLPVPWLPLRRRAITLSPFVVILRECAEDEAILAHEQKHLDQIAEYGCFKWYWRYIFDIDFRRRQEAEGYAVQWKIE